MREIDWIDRAYKEAENASVVASVKRITQTDKCGCPNCLAEGKRITNEWHLWGQTGQRPEKVIYKNEKPKALRGKR